MVKYPIYVRNCKFVYVLEGTLVDNFMDKLSQKINAQEMIKANAQAEANEMQRLQEQVAQYEAILQDMRKLNYKNTELTDKINDLVDESISKVQSSRGASADGAENAQEISADLSEAIMNAVNEAISNVNLQGSLNESVSNSLMVPVDVMRQSSEQVSGSVAAVMQLADDFKASADEIRNVSNVVTEANQELRVSVKSSVDNALLAMRRENREIADHLEYIRSSVEGIGKPSEEEQAERARKEEEALQREKEREEARVMREEQDKKDIQEMFKASDEYTRKENIKVYRNVQAVVVDEFKNQTEGLTKHNREIYNKIKNTKTAVTIAIILGAINIILTILSILNII